MANDLISRAEAIQSVSDWSKGCDNESINDAVTVIKTIIELLPAVNAIPLEWLRDKMMERQTLMTKNPFGYVLVEWLEQEANNG